VVVCARYKMVCLDVRALVEAVSVNGVAAAAVVLAWRRVAGRGRGCGGGGFGGDGRARRRAERTRNGQQQALD
jgi:hypothetical protein